MGGVRGAAGRITPPTDVLVAEEIVRSARVFFCQLLKTAPFNTTFKHNLARTFVAAARGTQIFLWISGEEGFVSNLKTLPPDAQFPQPQRHYEVARSPRRARRRAREHTHTNTPKHTPHFSLTHNLKMSPWPWKFCVLQNIF